MLEKNGRIHNNIDHETILRKKLPQENDYRIEHLEEKNLHLISIECDKTLQYIALYERKPDDIIKQLAQRVLRVAPTTSYSVNYIVSSEDCVIGDVFNVTTIGEQGQYRVAVFTEQVCALVIEDPEHFLASTE